MILAPDTGTSDSQTLSGTAATMTPTMGLDEIWMFVSSSDCYIAQGATPVAAAADGSMFVPAKTIVPIMGRAGAKLSVIWTGTAGTASLTRCMKY